MYIEVPGGPTVHCMKEMKGNSKGLANHYVFMNHTLDLEHGPFCTILHYIEALGWYVLCLMPENLHFLEMCCAWAII